MAAVTVLLGQALATAEQLPGQRREGVVHRGFGFKFGVRQTQLIAFGLEQAVAALGFADVAGHQRQTGGQFGGQFQQRFRGTFAQLKLQLADFFLALASDDEALVKGGFDHHLGFATTPGDLGEFAGEVGGEQRLDGLLSSPASCSGQQVWSSFLRSSLTLVPFVFVALGQPGHALAAALEGLDDDLAVPTQAQGNAGSREVAVWGVEVLVEQFAGLPAGLVALLQQGCSRRAARVSRLARSLSSVSLCIADSKEGHRCRAVYRSRLPAVGLFRGRDALL